MALATQCPHCQTTFRVAQDQLKLRAGLVRCGACKQIFNGAEHLLRPDELERPATAAPIPQPADIAPPVKRTADPEPDIEPVHTPDTENAVVITVEAPAPHPVEQDAKTAEPSETGQSEPDPAQVEPSIASEQPWRDDPLTRMTLMDFTHADDKPADADAAAEAPKPEDKPDVPDPLEEVIEALRRKPLRGAASKRKLRDGVDEGTASAFEEPSFIKQGRRRQRFGRALRLVMGAGSFVLLVSLLMQSAYVFRNQIAAWFPQAKPLLADSCAVLDCRVGLPAQIESVSIESSELQALAPEKNTFGLTALLRNQSATVQAWPNIELTLNDANEKAIARRVFTPRDYLDSAQDLTLGFAPKSELSVKLFFELSQLKASGYRVYLFYS
jgi:predicted Zn finger-like uncharacterized protein